MYKSANGGTSKVSSVVRLGFERPGIEKGWTVEVTNAKKLLYVVQATMSRFSRSACTAASNTTASAYPFGAIGRTSKVPSAEWQPQATIFLDCLLMQ